MNRNLFLATATFALLAGCGGDAAATNGGPSTSGNSSAAQHNLDMLNMYRSQAGLPALQLSGALNTFATTGSQELSDGGEAHAHFKGAGASLWTSGFCNGAGENQAPGWPVTGGDQNRTIDGILKAMMDEGPGGGHHDNILNPKFTLVGVGLILKSENSLYFTNDFSNACP